MSLVACRGDAPWCGTRLIPKLFPGHVLGDPTFRLTSFVSQSPGTIADQWESEDLDRTTKTSDIGRKEFWYLPRTIKGEGMAKGERGVARGYGQEGGSKMWSAAHMNDTGLDGWLPRSSRL